jgi:iron complex transport system substrate-binding protein
LDRLLALCLTCLVLSGLGTPAWADVTITDDLGREIRLPAPASRVIALYGAFNEILADLGREDILVARTSADELPPSLAAKPSIGTHLRPNAELILGLRPDLVIQLGGRDEALESVRFLEERGLSVAVFTIETFDQLFSVTQRLGILTASQDQATARVTAMREELERVQAQARAVRPRIFFEARYPNLLAAGQGSMVTEIISRAGGENCVTAPDKLVRLGEEEVLRLAPDIYLMQKGPMNPQPMPMAERPLFRTLDCLQADQVFVVEQGLFSRPGPRSLEAVRQLAGIIETWNTETRP